MKKLYRITGLLLASFLSACSFAGQNTSAIDTAVGEGTSTEKSENDVKGKEKFFLYFANSGNGIGVLTSDSPTGPWEDPLGKAIVGRDTPGFLND